MKITMLNEIEAEPESAMDIAALPLTYEIIKKYPETFSYLKKTIQSPVDYSTTLDLLLGEVMGIQFRKLCYQFYQGLNKQVRQRLCEKQVKQIDTALSVLLEECCENQNPKENLILVLRELAGTASEYNT